MESEKLRLLLGGYKNGSISEDELLEKLKSMPFEDIGYAKIDHDREFRTGYPEVIFCQGKTPLQSSEIAFRLAGHGAKFIIATRADASHYEAIKSRIPSAVYHETAALVTLSKSDLKEPKKPIAVLTAGTADIPVAEEAAVVASTLANRVERVYDVGVSGLHRLLSKLPVIRSAGVIIVVAGMEGALASVVGGLADVPVIAVPTSVGYGASFGGVSALLSMLNGCSAGVGVMNIDNGFGAAWLANRINRTNL